MISKTLFSIKITGRVLTGMFTDIKHTKPNCYCTILCTSRKVHTHFSA